MVYNPSRFYRSLKYRVLNETSDQDIKSKLKKILYILSVCKTHIILLNHFLQKQLKSDFNILSTLFRFVICTVQYTRLIISARHVAHRPIHSRPYHEQTCQIDNHCICNELNGAVTKYAV